MWDAAVLAGKSALPQLGWAFGVYVPTLLGFYVLVVGEQLGQLANAGRLRRLLGAVAEASLAALVPGILLALLYCATDSSQLGATFVILPAGGLLFFLAVQLGGFVVFDAAVQLDDAVSARERAHLQLLGLGPRSRRPVWLVVFANVVVVAATGCVGVGVVGAWAWLTEWLTFAMAATGAALLAGLAAFIAAMVAGRTVVRRIFAVAGALALWAVTIMLGLSLQAEAGRGALPGVVGLVVMAGAASFSALVSPRRNGTILADWTLTGAARAWSARSAERTYRHNSRRIEDLKRTLSAQSSRSLRDRMNAAWSVLKSS
jgi:hypothetical protein